MSNAFFVPFNHQPTSITYHTAPVTLGADEYAKLTALDPIVSSDNAPQGDQGITIDGNLFYPQLIWNSADWDSGETVTVKCSGRLYIVSQSSQVRVVITYGTQQVTHSGSSFGDAMIGGGPISTQAVSGRQAFCHIPYGATINIGPFTNYDMICWLEPYVPPQRTIWLPPSTVISSGDGSIVTRFMLERYSAIS